MGDWISALIVGGLFFGGAGISYWIAKRLTLTDAERKRDKNNGCKDEE